MSGIWTVWPISPLAWRIAQAWYSPGMPITVWAFLIVSTAQRGQPRRYWSISVSLRSPAPQVPALSLLPENALRLCRMFERLWCRGCGGILPVCCLPLLHLLAFCESPAKLHFKLRYPIFQTRRRLGALGDTRLFLVPFGLFFEMLGIGTHCRAVVAEGLTLFP